MKSRAKIAQPDWLTSLTIRSDDRRKSLYRAHLANAGEFNRRYLTCQISAILYADRGNWRKSQSLHRAHLAILADRRIRGDRHIKSPGVSPSLVVRARVGFNMTGNYTGHFSIHSLSITFFFRTEETQTGKYFKDLLAQLCSLPKEHFPCLRKNVARNNLLLHPTSLSSLNGPNGFREKIGALELISGLMYKNQSLCQVSKYGKASGSELQGKHFGALSFWDPAL